MAQQQNTNIKGIMGSSSIFSGFNLKLNKQLVNILRKRYWIYYVSVLVLVLLGSLAFKHLHASVSAGVRREAQAALNLRGSIFFSEIHRELGLLDGLRAYLSEGAQEELLEDEFAAFAKQLLANNTSVRYVAATPNGVQTFFYPMEQARESLAQDLFSLDESAVRDLYQAITTHQAIISDPQELQPGGDLVFLVRTAVYDQQELQGIVSLVLDVNTLIKESGLDSLEETNRIALRDHNGVVFYGEASVFLEGPVLYRVSEGVSGWEIGALPKAGWNKAIWSQLKGYVLTLLVVSLLLLWIVHLTVGHQQKLTKAVYTRTEALRGSEHRYRTLVEQAADAIFITDPDGKILEVNASAESLLGYSKAQFLQMCTQELIHSNDLAKQPIRVDLLEHDEPSRFERDLVHQDGRIISVEGNAKILPDGCLQSILHDVTERKKATEALRKSETLFRVIAENAVDVIYRIQLWPEFSVEYVSPSCAKVIGYTPQEILRDPMLYQKHIHQQDKALWQKMIMGEAQPNGKSISLRWVQDDGQEIVTEHRYTYIRDEGGKIVAMEGIARDITTRVKMEHALLNSEDRFATIFQASPDQIIITRLSDGIILECNSRFEKLMGFNSKEVVGRKIFELDLWENDTFHRRAFIKDLLKTGIFQQREIILRNRYGKSLPASIFARLIEINGDRCVLIVARDLAEINAAQSALAESENRYRRIFEDNSSVMFLLDPKTGKIVNANAAACRYYGYSKDRLLSMAIFDINDLSRDEVFAEMEAVRLERKRQFFFRHRLSNGEIRNVEVHSGPIWAEGRQLLYSTIHDINDRVEREKEQAAILETAAALRVAENRTAMIPIILDRVVGVVKAQMAGFFEPQHVNDEGALLELGRGAWAQYSGQIVPCTNPKLNSALRYGEYVLINDVPEEVDDLNCEFLRGINALLIKPLISNQEHIGTLFIGRKTAFTRLEERLIAAIADMAANAIRRDSLFHDLQASTDDLSRAYDVTLAGWAKALELRDKETEGHSRRVTEIAVRLAQKMGVTEGDIVQLRRGALLHDIGKMGVPDAILHKPGSLSEEEWEIMRMHPVYAYDLLKEIDFLAPALDIPYSHHERWDGTGYPRGLKGSEIPLAARIFAIVDVWDALLSDRPYRDAWPQEKVQAYLLEQAGTHFDPEVVRHFMEFISQEESVRLLEALAD